MTKQARPCLIVGNWKMYKTIEQAIEFVDTIVPIAEKSSGKVMLAVPYTAIKTLADKLKGTNVVVGAQNMNDAQEGAFTGEVAASMLKEAGAEFVILGHSERRTIFHETNEIVNRKVKRALMCDLQPILCVGESFDEREQNQSEKLLKTQLKECLDSVGKEAAKLLVLAYEPIWAIGSGLAATPELASEAMGLCRTILGELWGAKEAEKVPLLYGGSVTPKNADGYFQSKNIEGLLIGSASLSPDSFAKIISLRQNIATATKS